MADASSSDATSENASECFSDISSEKSMEYVVSSRRSNLASRRSETNFLKKLFTRETTGSLAPHRNAPEDTFFTTIPSWRHLSLLQVIPQTALQAGHIIMGLTQCGQFLLTYTYNIDVGAGAVSLFKYLLHWWAFSPNRVMRKVAEMTLFGNYSIYKELSIVIAQWPTERNKLVIHGLCSNWMQSQQTDKAFLTITTVPSLNNCRDCQNIASSYEEEELAAIWDNGVRCNCLQHGLTVHTTYEVISPYPKFRAFVCLNFANHVAINTGNFLHVLRVDLSSNNNNANMNNKSINNLNNKINEKLCSNLSDIESLNLLNTPEPEEAKADCFENYNNDDRISSASPKCDSRLTDFDFSEHDNSQTIALKVDENLSEAQDSPSAANTSILSNQSDHYICDNSKCSISNASNNAKKSGCCAQESVQCNCNNQQAISVKEKILQDFCDDVSQELNIGNDLVSLVRHPPCSPRSIPQRLPTDLKSNLWTSSILSPPSDILKTRNSDSSHKATHLSSTLPTGNTCINVTSINNSMHSVSIGTSSNASPRLMSPPLSRGFRQVSCKKRPNLISPNVSQTRNRSSHKLIMEAEKAYEFTDDSLEICEKLSSFRKRRLADKKYEFCDEAEDAENIVPFKYVRDQVKPSTTTIYHISPVASPLPHIRRHRIDSEQSESEDYSNPQDTNVNSDFQLFEMNGKNVLRPLNQNKITSFYRERSNKPTLYSISALVAKASLQYPTIKCTSHFKRNFVELDDELSSVITDVEDEETGCYASYQCVLPMQVHGADYSQMGMINNAKAEKLNVPCVSIHQMSFDIETFSHHIADWICKLYKKKYWHCSDYDIEIVDICALSGDVICLLIMKIQTSEQSTQSQCANIDDRKQYVGGCKFMWNIESNQYRITDVLQMKEVKSDFVHSENKSHLGFPTMPWNPTKHIVPQMRNKIQQMYTRPIRYLHNEMTLSGESIMRLKDMDNLTEFYITPIPNC